MNLTVICGRLTRDPEIRYTGTGEKTMAIARFTVAVSRRFKRDGDADADFFSCTAFGKNATFAEKYLTQGSKVIIRGSMEQDNYTNKDGQKVYSWNLKADEIDFGESKSSDANRTTDGSKTEKSSKKTKIEPKTDENGFMDVPDELMDEMPFA